ncbi:MAG: hypothetical protein JO081_12990 [Alphaproteobacteria bacterium]|nr:hypothetical protein [Alphaproteobacteria bacterium]
MRRILPLLAVVLGVAGCTTASVNKLDYRTYQIQDSGVPGGSSAPNRRVAQQVCPSGYRVLNERERRNTRDGYSEDRGEVFTTWTIRCL